MDFLEGLFKNVMVFEDLVILRKAIPVYTNWLEARCARGASQRAPSTCAHREARGRRSAREPTRSTRSSREGGTERANTSVVCGERTRTQVPRSSNGVWCSHNSMTELTQNNRRAGARAARSSPATRAKQCATENLRAARASCEHCINDEQ